MISKAIAYFGDSRSALCKAIGMFLSQVSTVKRPLPPRYAVLIEEATCGQVTAAELLPSVFAPRSTEKRTADDEAATSA